jgi:DnaJ-class molecular chaperone
LDPYQVLGLARDSGPEAVRAAYRRYAVLHHPDRGGDGERFSMGTIAYRRLSDAPERVEVVFFRRPTHLQAARTYLGGRMTSLVRRWEKGWRKS